MEDINYGEVFGVEPEVGAEEQEPAAPAEQGVEDQEVAAPDVEATQQETSEQEGAKTEEDAKYAAARRKAERERDEAIARARQDAQESAQRAIDAAFKNSGMVNPYTGQSITTKAEYDEYLNRFQQEQQTNLQKKAGLTPEQFNQFVNTLPQVRKAREAQAQAELATRQAREAQAKANVERQLKEISALDPTIKELKDLTKMPNYRQFYDLVKRGNTFVDAYRLANFDALTKKAVEASRKTAAKAAASKEHLIATTARGSGSVSVPEDVKAEYRLFNPEMTDTEIEKHYNKYLKGE